jgi:Zn finger protein HypA/HybF involved in hydrogenase expression
MTETTVEHNGEMIERVRAMLGQAMAEARTRGAARITALHLVMYDHSLEALRAVRNALDILSPGTLAEGAALVPTPALSNFICWNCCGLRYQADETDAMCPNCGAVGMIVPPEIIFSLDHIEIAAGDNR